MEPDPDAPGYRYPAVGERLWHGPWQQWVIVDAHDPGYDARAVDEVPIRFAVTGALGVVKLRSLVEGARLGTANQQDPSGAYGWTGSAGAGPGTPPDGSGRSGPPPSNL
jgi:hypothetical protein